MSNNRFVDKHVVITGAAGFLGSHLVKTLLTEGATVYGIDNFLTGHAENLEEIQEHSRFTFIEADVTHNPAEYLSDVRQIDVMLHFASPASPPRYQTHPIDTYLVNSHATHLLLEYLKQHFSSAIFVFASTSEIYGDPQVHPQPETYWGNVNPNGIRSCYDEAKRLGETICGVFARNMGIDVRIVRIFNTYGPFMDPVDGRIIPNFIEQALKHQPLTIYGDGTQTRSYCFVSDLIEAILTVATHPKAKGETYNIGNPIEKNVKETAEIIKQLTNSTSEMSFHPLPGDDPTRRKPDITKIEHELGWRPQVSLEEGLTKTIEYFTTK